MIWCVEDDASILDIEVYTLQSTGFQAQGFADGGAFWSALESARELPELVVLDVMLPGVDGVELLRRMRAAPATRSRIAADPADGEYALDLLMIAKYFERIGDHATNIAEWVIFSITGQHKEG